MLDILEISDLSLHLTQTGRPLLEHFSFTLGAGDRAVLIGEEGNGKSTLLRYLAQPEALKGYCEAEGRVALRGRPGYLPQLLPEALRECTPADYLAEIPAHRASKLLERLGLPQELAASERPIRTLSGGERVKLQLARILLDEPDVLLLDEPTNDLDVTTLSILEDYLQSFPGPIITVSHDRFFLDKMADTILEVRPEGRVDIFTGNWSDWARKRRPAEEKKPEKSEKTEKPQPERPREKKLKFSYNEQREFETIDAVLAELEEKLAACRRAQEACGSDYVRLQELTDEQERLSAELDEKTERWVYLNDLKEKIDAQNSQG